MRTIPDEVLRAVFEELAELCDKGELSRRPASADPFLAAAAEFIVESMESNDED